MTSMFVHASPARAVPPLPACTLHAQLQHMTLKQKGAVNTRPDGETIANKRRRLCSFSVQATAAAEIEVDAEGTGKIELNRQSYQSYFLEGCEFLIALTGDGRMDLRDVYVRDEETDIFARPVTAGELPETPQTYHELEWAEENLGDQLTEKGEPYVKVYKVYLIKVEQDEPFRLNLEEVFSLDHATRELRKEHVTRLTEETDPTNVTLRIRPEGLAIQENSVMPEEEDLVAHYLEQQQLEKERKYEAGVDAMVSPTAGEDADVYMPRDPIDALNDDEREYDESLEDTPEVDQGF